MTDSVKGTLLMTGKVFAVLLAGVGLVGVGITVGENRRQLDADTANIQTLQQSIAAEINARTVNDAQISGQALTVSVKLDDILRRLDRIERRISP